MKYIVFGQPQCNYCIRALNLLRVKQVRHEYIDIRKDTAAFKYIVETEGHKTVPQVYTEDAVGIRDYIGGSDDLVEHFISLTNSYGA